MPHIDPDPTQKVPAIPRVVDVVKLANGVRLEQTLDELSQRYGQEWVLNELYNWEHKARA